MICHFLVYGKQRHLYDRLWVGFLRQPHHNFRVIPLPNSPPLEGCLKGGVVNSPSQKGWQAQPDGVVYKDTPEFCYSAGFEEIKKKDFSLVPSKYIEFVNRDENIDFDDKMKALQVDFSELLQEEEKSKTDLLKVFKELGYEIDLN